VDAIKAGGSDLFLWDNGLSGFGVKATPSGAKVYLYQYRVGGRGNPTRRYTIGKHGALTPDQARTRAKQLAAMVEGGIDPRQAEDEAKAAKAEAQREAEAKVRLLGELSFTKQVDVWLSEYEVDHRTRTVEQARSIVELYLRPALADKPLPHITRADLQPIIDAIPLRSRAVRLAVYAYASIFFRWALERGTVEANPTKTMAKPKAPEARDRVLTDDELGAVWNASSTLSGPFGTFYRLLILTGQRRDEVAGMKWAELDRARSIWVIPADKAKNGKNHIVPLAPAVVAELDAIALALQVRAKAREPDATAWPKAGPVLTTDGATSIRSYSKAKLALDAAIAEARGTKENPAPLPAWRVHDLRRTLATGLQRLGVRLEVTEAVLNHLSGSRAGIVAVYQQHDWASEKRDALRSWAAAVLAIVAGHHPAQFTNEAGEADPKAWQGYIAACVANGGKPVPINQGKVLTLCAG
jgi:integrase